jgi:protein-tyrosine-phosphatase
MINILFVCRENACRSQIAEGFARAIAGPGIRVFSGGSDPSGVVSPQAIAVMAERGIDISRATSKGFKDLPTVRFDYAVGMGCGDVCPVVPAGGYRTWQIDDPQGKDDNSFRAVRDAIEVQVKELLAQITEK